jgi:D-lactate dehydrogenase (cytochrome)
LEELSSAMRELTDHREPVTISGARTGIVGGAVAAGGETLLSLEKFVFRPQVHLSERFHAWTVTAAPGMTLDALRGAVPASQLFPVDPTEGRASLGGMIATNASGARTLFYGPTRAWVAGLTLVMANGEVGQVFRGEAIARNGELQVLNRRLHVPNVRIPVTKHAVGYHSGPAIDAVDLFVGGEGTLAVVAGVELFLAENPKEVRGVVAFLRSGQPIVDLVSALKRDETIGPRALEFMDSGSLLILTSRRASVGRGLPELPDDSDGLLYVECAASDQRDARARLLRIGQMLSAYGILSDHIWEATAGDELEKIRAMRHTLPQSINALIRKRREVVPGLTKLATDCAVPDGKLAEMMRECAAILDEAGLARAVFGHIGNAHLHINILPRSLGELSRAREAVKTIARMAVSFGGSVSGEHGIGRLKKDLLELQYSQQEIAGLRSVKDELDPQAILNPGVLW